MSVAHSTVEHPKHYGQCGPSLKGGRRLFFIYNPTAGQLGKRLFKDVLDRLAGMGCKFDILETAHAGDAQQIMRRTDVCRYDAVVAVGGDGTVREIINGFDGRHIPLGIIPIGTANVLAKELGLSRNAAHLSKTIAFGSPLSICPGLANESLFLLMAGIGFDARVVEGVNVGLKRAAGKIAYVESTFRALAQHRRCSYSIVVDGLKFEAAAVIIAKSHFYGGGFVVAEKARLEVPLLQVALFQKGRRRDLVRYAVALGTGRLPAENDFRVFPASEVRIDGPAGEKYQLDGDLAGSLPIHATIARNPISILRLESDRQRNGLQG